MFRTKVYLIHLAPLTSGSEFNGVIPISALQLSYSASSGPGGQNVNKVHTKVDLRFKLEEATWLSKEVKDKLKVSGSAEYICCIQSFSLLIY